ncbi:chitobiase/beta-hexosaminidase C-terminal domain-containing protein [Maribacter sp. 2304DJ31-5]|uniref:chitobiase/beta-hexosaminidase C-terminal domain-containing protein n=1 Tax=Maribacter sp. 2304DJ31-5 TaxID=3386273 RepID=UPI0039BD3DB1
MINRILFILFFACAILSCKEEVSNDFAPTRTFKLAPPQFVVDSLLFKESARIEVDFDLADAQIRYTDDGKEVTENSNLYQHPLSTDTSALYTFRAFHPDYQKSDAVYVKLIQIKNDISGTAVTVAPDPHSNYLGKGSNGLTDLQKGTIQFRKGKEWSGFQTKEIKINLNFEKAILISKLTVSTLRDHGSWIFSPRSIIVLTNGKKLGELMLAPPKNGQSTQTEFLEIPIIKGKYKTVDVQIHSLKKIPEWHQGKGTVPFFFMDEILIE